MDGIIRRATSADRDALAALKLTTFRQTFLDGFAIPYPPADLALFEAETYAPARVAAELADPAHVTWVVDRPDGALVAYAHIGPCKLPHPDVAPGDMEIYQIYLRAEAQGAGLGKHLLDHAIAYLDAAGHPIWLGVWSGNAKAQTFYHACGFEKVGEYQFKVGDWRDDEYIFRRLASRQAQRLAED